MDWENERYVRLYIRDTAAWRMWPWEARAVLPLLMRKLDRSGRTPLDKHGVEGIAVLIELPVEVTRAGLKALVEDGCIVAEPGSLCMPNFTAGQTARQSAAVRKAEQRERDQMEKDAKPRKACAPLPPSIAGLLDNDEKSRDVTRCDSRHSSLAEPSLAELNLDPPLPPAVAGGISPLVPVPSDAAEQDATGSLLQLEALRAPKPKGLTPAGFMDLWSTHSGGTRIGRAPEGKRLAGIKRCLKARPRREDWLPVLAKVKELRALPDTGWLTIDWLVRDVSHADRLVDGAFDWKLTAAAPPKPHRHDGLPRIDAPKPERKPGDRDVLRCADCFEILPHTWTDDGWTPDPHPCAESAMEMP